MQHYKTTKIKVSKTIKFADWVFLRDKINWISCHIQNDIMNEIQCFNHIIWYMYIIKYL